MNNNITKTILLLFTGALIPILLAGAVYIYLTKSFEGFEWSDETRNILFEKYSPDKKYKVGVYNYDIGALGYSAVQASIMESQDTYPIAGNVLPYQYVNSVKWVSDNKVELIIGRENNLNSKIIIDLE